MRHDRKDALLMYGLAQKLWTHLKSTTMCKEVCHAQRRRYTKQFKEEAIRLASQEGVKLTQVAHDLGLDANMFRRW